MAPLITNTPKRSKKATWLLILLITMPLTMLILLGFIALVIFLDRAGYHIRTNQLFAYMIASIMGIVFFPLAVAANHRWIWYIKHRPPGPMPEWGSVPTPPVPRIPLTVAQRLLRVLILIVGALTLIVICGPMEVTRTIWSGVSFMGSGPASSGAFFQLMIYLIMFALLGALFLADSWLSKRRVLNETDQFAHDLRLNWYTAAIAGWVQALLLGLIFAYMVIAYM